MEAVAQTAAIGLGVLLGILCMVIIIEMLADVLGDRRLALVVVPTGLLVCWGVGALVQAFWT